VSRTTAIGLVLLVGCATSQGGDVSRTSRKTGEVVSPAVEGEPEIVRAPPRFNIGSRDALARYAKGARCNGSDAPETVIGKPDQRNQLEVARDRIVTYGFRFPQGTLFIRCRGKVVETVRLIR
jgi:hypothetical protein